MSDMPDHAIPFGQLEYDANGHAVLRAAEQITDLEVAGALLTRVMHRRAAGAAGHAVAAVSVAISVTGQVHGHTPIAFRTLLQRRTRTLVFLKGEAWRNDRPIMVADSVFRISGKPEGER